jgi:hypothetical protein
MELIKTPKVNACYCTVLENVFDPVVYNLTGLLLMM